jgi:hypothetical protein
MTATEEGGYHRMGAALRQVHGTGEPDAVLGVLKLLALARDLT